MEMKKNHIFNSLSFYILTGTFFLSFFFFIPYLSVSIEAAKGFIISIGVTLSIFFWLMARLVDGKFVIPKDRIILFAGIIPLVFLIASLFSSSLYLSLFGQGFEIGTFGTMLILFITLLLSSIYFQTESRMRIFFKAVIFGTAVLALFQFTQLFVGFERIAPGMFKGIMNGNLLGTWNNFSLLFGGVLILIIAIFEFISVKKNTKIGLFIFGLASLFLLILVNVFFVWILVGIFSLVIFIYSISQNRTEDRTLTNFPYLSFIVVLISLLFLVGNDSLSTIIAGYFGAISPEVAPSISGTMNLVPSALKHNPFFGTGPNTFAIDWSMWRPAQVVQSMFWNIDFTSGFGMIPTYIVTTGVVGIIAWLLFIIAFVLRAFQSIFFIISKNNKNYYLILSILLALYFWIGAFISNPNIVEMMIAFAATGVFIGALVSLKLVKVYDISFLEDPRMSFFSILGLVLLMILSIGTCYLYTEKFSSIVYFSKSVPLDNTQASLIKSESQILKAISLDKNDAYYRALSQIYLAEIQVLLSDKSISADTLKATTQDRITNIENAITSAIKQNPKYYVNWFNAGNAYTSLLSFGVTGSYENAVSAYKNALDISPSNPSIILSQAQLELVNKDIDKAKSYIEEALKVKPNYIDALFARSQIKYDAGDRSGAIGDAELAAKMAPGDTNVFFKLGSLKYNNTDYTGAISAFEMAVRLDQNNHNARYMLGLAYKKAGRNEESHTQFEILHKIFPDNKEVTNAYNGNTDQVVAPAVNTPDQLKKTGDNAKQAPVLPKKSS